MDVMDAPTTTASEMDIKAKVLDNQEQHLENDSDKLVKTVIDHVDKTRSHSAIHDSLTRLKSIDHVRESGEVNNGGRPQPSKTSATSIKLRCNALALQCLSRGAKIPNEVIHSTFADSSTSKPDVGGESKQFADCVKAYVSSDVLHLSTFHIRQEADKRIENRRAERSTKLECTVLLLVGDVTVCPFV